MANLIFDRHSGDFLVEILHLRAGRQGLADGIVQVGSPRPRQPHEGTGEGDDAEARYELPGVVVIDGTGTRIGERSLGQHHLVFKTPHRTQDAATVVPAGIVNERHPGVCEGGDRTDVQAHSYISSGGNMGRFSAAGDIAVI